MTYSFTPGQYDPVEQTDIVPEQEKSNQRILDSEEKYFDEMRDRDDALVKKTQSQWESLGNLSSKVNDFLKVKAEKNKKEALQRGSYLALINPASKEQIQALANQEKGLMDSHLKVGKIADQILADTGDFELSEQFRNLSGWEQYAYVKASLTKSARGYTDFKNERRNTIFIEDKNTGERIGYNDNPDASQLRALDAKVRFEFSEQFLGVNEQLLAATVGPEIMKIDEAEYEEARKKRNELAQDFKTQQQENEILDNITSDPQKSREYVDFWVKNNKGLYKGEMNARLAFRKKVIDAVSNGTLSSVDAEAMVKALAFHSGDKKNVNLEHYKEFKGFEEEIRQANAKYRSKKLDDDKFAVEANAEKLREEVEKSGNLLTTDQKKAYLEQREKDFPDIPLNQDEQFLIYGYRDDGAMRVILNQKAVTFGGITELDLKEASPAIRKEFANELIPDGNQQLISINSLGTEDKKFVTDLVSNSAKSTGSLEAKNLQYYALLAATEETYTNAYNEAIAAKYSPAQATEAARKAIIAEHADGVWVTANSEYKTFSRNDEYERKFKDAKLQIRPEDHGYATTQLEAPIATRNELIAWAKNGGKGPVPYYYQTLASEANILPRELAWRQAEVLLGEPAQWNQNEEIKKFEVPLSVVHLFLNKPTKNKKKRLEIEAPGYVKGVYNPSEYYGTNEVHPYEDDEDID